MNYHIKLECIHYGKTDGSLSPASYFNSSTTAYHNWKTNAFLFSFSLLSSLLNTVAKCYGLPLLDTDMQIHIYPPHRFIRLLVVLINKLLLNCLSMDLLLLITSNCQVMMAFSMLSLTSVKLLMTVCL